MWLRRLKNFLNARIIMGTFTSTIMILGVAWFIADRDYEPAIAALTGIAAFVGLFKYSFLSFDKNLAADRIALIVGNDDYPQLGQLQTVSRDVDAVCESMAEKGFRIIKRVNPSTMELKKAIYDFQTILIDVQVCFWKATRPAGGPNRFPLGSVQRGKAPRLHASQNRPALLPLTRSRQQIP
jgi:hypothetical protein